MGGEFFSENRSFISAFTQLEKVYGTIRPDMLLTDECIRDLAKILRSADEAELVNLATYFLNRTPTNEELQEVNSWANGFMAG